MTCTQRTRSTISVSWQTPFTSTVAKASMEITVSPKDGTFQASAGNAIPGPGNQISKEITQEAMDEAVENLKLQVTTLKKLALT